MQPDKEILQKIKASVLSNEPMAKLFLFGSRAGNNAKADSDWDILILLNRKSIGKEKEEAITNNLFDIGLETGQVISPAIYTEQEWHQKYKVTPFYENVMESNIAL
jgi:predicted nucleotidyltransferase